MLRIVSKIATALLLVTVLPAYSGCTTERERSNWKTQIETEAGKVAFIADLGKIDGCSAKYVVVVGLPDFYLIRCGQNETQNFYETGGKSKTHAGVLVQE